MSQKTSFARTNLSVYSSPQPEINFHRFNRLISQDEGFIMKFTSDALDFYKLIYEQKSILKVEVLNYLRGNGNSYIIYLIQIDTAHLTFQISKRYSEFYSWFEKANRYLDDQTCSLFPPKKLFGNKKLEFLDQRLTQLNEFIQSFIVNQQPILLQFWFLDFLEVRRQFIIHQIKLTNRGLSLSSNNRKKVNPDEEQIIDFVEQLNLGLENLTQTFSDIDEFFTKQKPRVANETVHSLLLGCKQHYGLIQTLGSLNGEKHQSHLICSSGFKLLNMLLDYELNRDAETFIKVFSNLSNKTVSQLHMSNHITANLSTPCKHYILRIIDLYLCRNNIYKEDQILQLLEQNQEAVDEYKDWKEQRNMNNAVKSLITNEIKQKSRILKSKAVGSNFDELELYWADKKWKLVQKELKQPFVKFKQMQLFYQNCEKKGGIYQARKQEQIATYLTEFQAQWNAKLMGYEFGNVDGKMSMSESYSWGYKNQLYVLKYDFEASVVSEEGTVSIYKQTADGFRLSCETNNSNEKVGEALCLIRIQPSKKRAGLFKVKMIWKHLNQISQSYFFPQMTGEEFSLAQSMKKLQSLLWRQQEQEESKESK